MAYIGYNQRGKKRLWSYTIREGNRSLQYKGGFKTKREAKIEAEKILHKLNTGSTLKSDMTLVELYQEWLDLKILPSKRSEVTKQKYIMRKRTIKKLFGNKRIAEIKPSYYQKVLNEYGQSVTRNYLGRLNSSIKACLQMAIADKVVVEDFTAYAELFSMKSGQDASEKYLHTEKDYFDLLSELKRRFAYGHSIVPYIIFCLLKTGMRFSELIALTWDDIDKEKGYANTYRRYNTLTHRFTPAKNKTSVRKVPLPREVLDLLIYLQKEQLKYNKELALVNKDNMIFQHYGYVYGIPDIATVNKAMRVILEELEIEPIITTKGARHTYGSYLWHKGVDLGVIAKILGHKDISMLVEVYGHTLEEKITQEFESIKSLL